MQARNQPFEGFLCCFESKSCPGSRPLFYGCCPNPGQTIQQSNSDIGHALQISIFQFLQRPPFHLSSSSSVLLALQSISKKKFAFFVAHFFNPIHSSCLTKNVRKKTETSFTLTHTWEKKITSKADAHHFIVLLLKKTRCMI